MLRNFLSPISMRARIIYYEATLKGFYRVVSNTQEGYEILCVIVIGVDTVVAAFSSVQR